MGQSHCFGMSGCMITLRAKFQHFLNFENFFIKKLILYFEASLHTLHFPGCLAYCAADAHPLATIYYWAV